MPPLAGCSNTVRLLQEGPPMTTAADATIHRIMESEAFRRAHATLAAEHERTVQDIVTLTEIEAPSFQEAKRAQAWRAMAEAHGLQELEIDAEGNVTGIRRGAGNGRLVCVAAHLDTVFPPGTDVTVRREGTKLFAPGVGDDTRSLAVLLAWLRAMDAAGITTRDDLLFVADVGEEGPGDLRGMRHLFQRGRYKDRISAFLTVDSPDIEHIAIGGVGSKRYRVDLQRAGRAQLWRVRPGQPDVRDGRCDRPAGPRGGAGAARRRPTAPASPAAAPRSTRSRTACGRTSTCGRNRRASCDRLEQQFMALVDAAVNAENASRSTARRQDHGGAGEDRRPAGWPHERVGCAGAACPRRDRGAWLRTAVRILLDRCEHPDEPGYSRDQDRLRADRRARPFAGRMDRCRTGSQRCVAWRPGWRQFWPSRAWFSTRVHA